MALIKEKVLPNGESGNYWKITKIIPSKEKLILSVQLDLFKGSSKAINGSMHSLGAKIVFNFTVDAQDLSGDLFLLGYSKIKSVMNSVLRQEVEHQDAIPEIQADEENNIPYQSYVPEVLAKQAIYKYPELFGAIDA